MAATALILAAGLGTRMRSSLGKVLHPVRGWPLVRHGVAACEAAGMRPHLVVHHQEDAVRAALADLDVGFSRQHSPRGTGDAVTAALPDLPASGVVVILPGDAPLIRAQTLSRLLDAHAGRLVTCLSMVLDDAGAYGRILRDDGPLRIVEAAELSDAQRAVLHEVNSGIYAVDLAFLRQVLPTLSPHPPKDEIYLTDIVQLAAERGGAEVLVHDGDAEELLGVNDRVALARAGDVLGARILVRHGLSGVSFEQPGSTVVEVGVRMGRDVSVGAGCVIRRGAEIGDDVEIGPHCVIGGGARIASGARIRAFSLIEAGRVDGGASVGPFSRMRPGAVVEEGARLGNFVEVKNAVIERGAKVNHLTYVGDARVGAGANLGAGTITCNYDGYAKHHTDIGAGAFIGSNVALVAPVSVGDGAIVGAGSVVVEDVPADALTLARGRQANKPGMARRIRLSNERRAQQRDVGDDKP